MFLKFNLHVFALRLARGLEHRLFGEVELPRDQVGRECSEFDVEHLHIRVIVFARVCKVCFHLLQLSLQV
jgi:hypothetical protein